MKQLLFFAILMIVGAAGCTSQTESKGYTDLDVAAFKAKMSEPGVVLLDVRTPEETAEGKIAECAELDFRSEGFEAEIDKLDKDKTYLIYCRSGNRSGQTCALMAKKGFKHLYNLDGGYEAWTQE